MLEVAGIFRLYGAAYRARFGDRLLASLSTAGHAGHRSVPHGVLRRPSQSVRSLRPEGLHLPLLRQSALPNCHRDQTDRWLEKQRARLLPCFYFLLTFTLPSELHAVARAHQKKVYGLLMRTAVAAVQKLCRDPHYLGARIGCLAVLHTWTRALLYHPHVHLLVTAGGLSADGTHRIRSKHSNYLVPEAALAIIFRAKLCAALPKAQLLDQVPRRV
jgi:hypothetical protein